MRALRLEVAMRALRLEVAIRPSEVNGTPDSWIHPGFMLDIDPIFLAPVSFRQVSSCGGCSSSVAGGGRGWPGVPLPTN